MGFQGLSKSNAFYAVTFCMIFVAQGCKPEAYNSSPLGVDSAATSSTTTTAEVVTDATTTDTDTATSTDTESTAAAVVDTTSTLYHLTTSGDSTRRLGICGSIDVQITDTAGTTTPLASETTFSITGTTGSEIYSTSDCTGTAISTITGSAAASSLRFYYRSIVEGAITFSISAARTETQTFSSTITAGSWNSPSVLTNAYVSTAGWMGIDFTFEGTDTVLAALQEFPSSGAGAISTYFTTYSLTNNAWATPTLLANQSGGESMFVKFHTNGSNHMLMSHLESGGATPTVQLFPYKNSTAQSGTYYNGTMEMFYDIEGVSINSSGDAIITSESNNDPYYYTYDFITQTFSPHTDMPCPIGCSMAKPVLFDDGNAIVTYVAFDGTYDNVYLATFNGTTLGTPITIDTSNNSPYNAGNIKGKGEQVLIVWQQQLSSTYDIVAAFYDRTTGTVTTPTVIEAVTQNVYQPGLSERPILGADNEGNYFVFFKLADSSAGYIVRYSAALGAWQDAVSVDEESGILGAVESFHFSVDATGNAFFSFVQKNGSGFYQPYVMHYVKNLGWSDPVKLIDTAFKNGTTVAITQDSLGRAVAGFTHSTGTNVMTFMYSLFQ